MDEPQDTKSAHIIKIEEWRGEIDEVRRELAAAASGCGEATNWIAVQDRRRRIVNLNRRISRMRNNLAAVSLKDAGDEIGNCKSNGTACAKPVSAKRQIVLDALLGPQNKGKSERDMGRALGVSPGLVGKVRRELTAAARERLASDDRAIATVEAKVAELKRDHDNVFALIRRQGFRSLEAIRNSCDIAPICVILEKAAYEKLQRVLSFMFPDMRRGRLGRIIEVHGKPKPSWPRRPLLDKTKYVSPGSLYDLAAE